MIEKLRRHKESNHRVRIYSKVSKNKIQLRNGYVLGFSDSLLLLNETDDFRIDGYVIIRIDQIKKIRFNKGDKYFDKMMRWENAVEKVGIKYHVDLSDWRSAFKSLKNLGLNVIAECEAEDIDTFTIGPITKVGKKYVYITDFDIEGFFDDSPTSIDYESITRVAFDTEYLNIFGKYTQQRKAKL
ncbi:MAG: hypothetical protein JWQ57_3309 [Mucilaginibacter sp.]|nr:hypothetical protein [Mucilaginibacter sp.]